MRIGTKKTKHSQVKERVKLKMNLCDRYIVLCCNVFLTCIFQISVNGVPCPGEDDIICVQCNCTDTTSFNSCEPIRTCPKPVTKASKIRRKDKQSKCPYGKVFTAQCTLCECSGEGGDHCAFCYALPVRRNGQPDNLNRKLPQVTDNRFFNYEINGWDAPEEDK